MNPIIKWPGGKSGEISKIESLIPSFDRYVEPFFGGGALYFYLKPKKAAINDISKSLMQFYELVKAQDTDLYAYLLCYNSSFQRLQQICRDRYDRIYSIFSVAKETGLSKDDVKMQSADLVSEIVGELLKSLTASIVIDRNEFQNQLLLMFSDKVCRTVANDKKAPFNAEDLQANLITGFTSGFYMYFRKVFNDINLGRIKSPSVPYEAANFYFIREYCYGSMFRYNSKGEFNIPYGGMSYNEKNLQTKISSMFNPEMSKLFGKTVIAHKDFADFIDEQKLTEKDFMFLDPPYDTDFSDYEGQDFTKQDQQRLADVLRGTKAKFILVIKNTPFIMSLYEEGFNILSFDNHYTYNVRSRNDRKTEHLIITNLPINS